MSSEYSVIPQTVDLSASVDNATIGYTANKLNIKAFTGAHPRYGTPATENSGFTFSHLYGSAPTVKFGVKILTKSNLTMLVSFTKGTQTTATKGYILNSSKAVIATADFVGDVVTFNYILQPGTNYYLVMDSNGSATTLYDVESISYPVNGTNANFVGGVIGASDDTVADYAVASFITKSVDIYNIDYP